MIITKKHLSRRTSSFGALWAPPSRFHFWMR